MTKLLLVEDDPGIVKSLTEFLQSEGFLVDSASGQGSACRLLEDNSYDLVLLDISLKDGNGFSLCKIIKSEYQIPVIFLTATAPSPALSWERTTISPSPSAPGS